MSEWGQQPFKITAVVVSQSIRTLYFRSAFIIGVYIGLWNLCFQEFIVQCKSVYTFRLSNNNPDRFTRFLVLICYRHISEAPSLQLNTSRPHATTSTLSKPMLHRWPYYRKELSSCLRNTQGERDSVWAGGGYKKTGDGPKNTPRRWDSLPNASASRSATTNVLSLSNYQGSKRTSHIGSRQLSTSRCVAILGLSTESPPPTKPAPFKLHL
jgi:hypothetical protein